MRRLGVQRDSEGVNSEGLRVERYSEGVGLGGPRSDSEVYSEYLEALYCDVVVESAIEAVKRSTHQHGDFSDSAGHAGCDQQRSLPLVGVQNFHQLADQWQLNSASESVSGSLEAEDCFDRSREMYFTNPNPKPAKHALLNMIL